MATSDSRLAERMELGRASIFTTRPYSVSASQSRPVVIAGAITSGYEGVGQHGKRYSLMRDQLILPDHLFADLRRSDPLPLYVQIAQRIESAIADGLIPLDARLENEVDLAIRLKISRPTMRRSILYLVERGVLVRQRGIGTKVVQGQVSRRTQAMSLYEELELASRHPSTTILELSQVTDAEPDVIAALGLERGDPLVYIRRERLADAVPVAVMENWVPALFADITARELESGSLYEAMRVRGSLVRIVRQTLSARTASESEARQLRIPEGSAVLAVARLGFDSSGRAVDFGRHCLNPSLYSFETILVV